jgi:hypothetical protein
MKILKVKRKSIYERRYTAKMGELTTRVTYIKKHLFGWPVKTVHKYRETYYGRVKDCSECQLFI